MKKAISFILSVVFFLTFFVQVSAASADKATLNVNCINGSDTSVYVDGKYVSKAPCNIKVKLNASVKFVSSNDSFMFYSDSENNIICEGKEYTFTFLSSSSFSVWSESASKSAVFVVYRNTNDTKQVLSYATYSDINKMTSHLLDDCAKFACDFVSWDKSVDRIKALAQSGIGMIFIEPIYETSSEKVMIKAENGTVNGEKSIEIAVGSVVKLSAAENDGEKKFAYWTNADGNIVSDSVQMTVTVAYSETYTAVFLSDTEKTELEPLTYVHATYSELLGKFILYTGRFIPQGSEIEESGILYTKDINISEENMTVEGSDGMTLCRMSHTSAKNSSGVVVNRLSCNSFAYVRPYLIAKDGTVIYGKAVKISKN